MELVATDIITIFGAIAGIIAAAAITKYKVEAYNTEGIKRAEELDKKILVVFDKMDKHKAEDKEVHEKLVSLHQDNRDNILKCQERQSQYNKNFLSIIQAKDEYATKDELRDLRKETNDKLERNYQETLKLEKKVEGVVDVVRELKDEIRDTNKTSNVILKEIMKRPDITS
jgi:hypothetical protein